MKKLAIALALALPLAAPAAETKKVITTPKPELMISVREPCLELALKSKLGVLLGAKLLSEDARTMKVECTFYK